ncbi:cold shock domain-containing protein [Stappia sp. GBMRC 2046]|uniref:Cold shock domain-containing protein n=1 Tax=Stappia sediminis TaxID=2692190 RepID=A0A7X3LWR0_9HYPH|nr:cold shock domain-containing protein [Stappia sediminis]MXN66472.1 cold shock domain-containing protein [Stappia sediminis]
MQHGNVKWFDALKGIGLIEPDEGADVFVAMDAVRKAGRSTLKEGQLVAYDLAYASGRQVADNLRVL